MKNLKYTLWSSLFFLFLIGCQDDDTSMETIQTPTNLTITYDIAGVDTDNPNGDGSGVVNFKASAENAISYKFIFPDGDAPVGTSGEVTKRLTKSGLNTYTVKVVASGSGGITTIASINLDVQVNFRDEQAVAFLTGGSSKTWYVSASEPGHLGVGPNNADATVNYYPNYYQAAPFEKAIPGEADCLYEDELVFSLDDDGETLLYEQDNMGKIYFNAAYENVAGGSQGFDYCYDYDTSGQKTVNLSPSESVVAKNNIPTQTTGTVMNFTNNGFMAYYIGSSSYEILSITANRMAVRAVMGSDAGLAWYLIFTTEKPSQTPPPTTTYDDLVWSDEFDVDGPPNPENWVYDLGVGQAGWGNNESQYYTDRSENISVADGMLNITAQAEDYSGSAYTSARIKTEDLQEFTYGRIEIRAKLPSGGGTWPALWMLGANYQEVGWPTTGEIDIMEHVGNQPNKVFSTLHYPGHSGGNGDSQEIEIANVEDDFHIYKMIWSPASLEFYVDDQLYHTFINSEGVPFNKDFFFILNVAMGGNFGGAIDPAFTASTMQVDYVRVYQ